MMRVRVILATIVGSAMLTVLIAWSCMLWSPFTHTALPSDTGDGRYPEMIVGPDGSRGWWSTSYGFGAMVAARKGARGSDGEFLYWRGSYPPVYFRAGWPMYAMQSVVQVVKAPDGHYVAGRNVPVGEMFRRGPQTDRLPGILRARGGGRLPLVPMWRGFVVDTVINSVCVFAIVSAMRTLVRRVRSIRGRKRVLSPIV
jgi:hypothetical protein